MSDTVFDPSCAACRATRASWGARDRVLVLRPQADAWAVYDQGDVLYGLIVGRTPDTRVFRPGAFVQLREADVLQIAALLAWVDDAPGV